MRPVTFAVELSRVSVADLPTVIGEAVNSPSVPDSDNVWLSTKAPPEKFCDAVIVGVPASEPTDPTTSRLVPVSVLATEKVSAAPPPPRR